MLPRPRAESPFLVLALSLAALVPARGQNVDSPFLPPASVSATAAAKTAASGYELVGMTEVGREILLSINRQSDKHSVWVAVGKTVGEITAVSYDPAADSAVIRADSQTLTLPMRKGAVVAGAVIPPVLTAPIAASVVAGPTPVPQLPPVAVPTKPMTLQEEKETEARMLVTDLLEIGQQQRKAYEEAQRQAAKRAADPKMPRADAATPKKR